MSSLVALLCVTTLWTDLRYRKVLNVVLVAALLAAACMVALGYGGAHTLGARFAGCMLGAVILLPPYLVGRMGAGDVKFFAVIGWFIGPSGLLPVWVAGTLLALAHAVAEMARRRGHHAGGAAMPNSPVGHRDRDTARTGLPYAGYLALGAILWTTALDGKV